MKVAILQCDSVLEKFQPQFGNYPEMISSMFAEVLPPLSFDTYNCQQGEFPTDIYEYDFYITTGSKASVYEDISWVQQLIEFVGILYKQKRKLIGICFGHQIMAMALQGKVEKSPKGWGIGIARNQITDHPKWMHGEFSEINILVSHQDQISQLPDDSLIIASTDFCPYFIVQWGGHFLSIQGHPEWKEEYSRALMNNRRDIIAADLIEQGLASLATAPDNQLFVQWIMDFVLYEEQL